MLVAALIAAPVLGTASLDTAFRTAALTAQTQTQTQRDIGAADGTLTVTSFAQVDSLGTTYGTSDGVAERRQVRDAALVLANGGRRSDVRRMLLARARCSACSARRPGWRSACSPCRPPGRRCNRW